MKVSMILTCAGKGERAGFSKNKLLVKVNGKTCLERAYNTIVNSGLIDQIVITASPQDVEEIRQLVGQDPAIVIGGDSRSSSVRNALDYVTGDIVLIHDGARPFLSSRIISDCIESVVKYGSAITAIPSVDTVCRADEETISQYLGKEQLYSIQTPQAFFTTDIKKAYQMAGSQVFNDDGSVYKKYIGAPRLVLGSRKNVKITYANDFELLNSEYALKIGTGFDCHRFEVGRKLILGGVCVPYEKGLLGHSDADVLIHAIMDATLSSLSMRDIGYWFSDKDPKYKDADSMVLFDKVIEMIKEKGYKIKNVSASIMAEKPKLIAYVPAITESIAKRASLPLSNVGITCTTLEGLGFVGREEGICVSAVVSVTSINDNSI